MGAETSLKHRCDQAELEIEATRRRIQDKAGLLEDRLKPRALLRPVQKRLEETLGAGGARILDTFRENPLPLALTGLGLGWLMLRDLRRPAPAPPGAPSLAEKAEDVASKVKATAADAVHKAKETARRTSDWFSTTLEERPILLALGALAAGMAAAFLAPMSRAEKEALGKLGEKAADALLDKGKEALEPSPPQLQPQPQEGDLAPPAT
jgi:hypothetical protein